MDYESSDAKTNNITVFADVIYPLDEDTTEIEGLLQNIHNVASLGHVGSYCGTKPFTEIKSPRRCAVDNDFFLRRPLGFGKVAL
jgi:hypothetical protein